MRRGKLKRYIAVAMAVMSLASSVTGCGSASNKFVSDDVTKYPLVSALTTQEIVDYYAKSLEYDAVVSRNLDVHKTTYVLQDVPGNKQDVLKELQKRVEEILSKNEYEFSEENEDLLSVDNYNYIKATLDDKQLVNGRVKDIKGALGYYFVDVEYDILPKQPGEFTEFTNYLGLNGVWIEKSDGTCKLNSAYLQTAMNVLNKNFRENNKNRCAVFNQDTGTFSIVEGMSPYSEVTTNFGDDKDRAIEEIILNDGSGYEGAGAYHPDGSSDTGSETQYSDIVDEEVAQAPGVEEATEGTEENNLDTLDGAPEAVNENAKNLREENKGSVKEEGDSENKDETYEVDAEAQDSEEGEENKASVTENRVSVDTAIHGLMEDKSLVNPSRKSNLDTKFINDTVGSSLNRRSYLPSLDLVYIKPEETGLSGYGIYPSGVNGLKVFSLDRQSIDGTMSMRYIFKDDAAASGKILGKAVYVINEQLKTGISAANQNVVIPSFLEEQFNILIERMDRVESNVDLSGMMNGDIYEDMGFTVLSGYKDSSSRTLKHLSTLRQVLKRDETYNCYLLDVETTVTEGPRSTDLYNTYRDRYYVVVQQQNDKFVISDKIRMSRTLAVEGPIEPDTATQKRLVALNLSGEVAEKDKEDISSLISALYTAGTNRILSGPVQKGDVTIETGLYDCFEKDTSMLSSDNFEYTTQLLMNKLTKYGTDTTSVHSGTITEWIGGWENQAELITEEVITYEGRDEGYYMSQVYYLVSKMEDKWVIDERKVLDEYEISGGELESVKSRLGQ